MSKKILSLALVVVMLMSTLALTAFAASGPLSSVGIKVVSDATVGMKAGEEVTVKVYFTAPDGADTSDYLHNMSNVVLAYTDAFELNTAVPNSTESADARTWGASYADYISDVNSLVNSKTQLYDNYSKLFTENDKAKGWDALILVQQAFAQTATTGYALDPDCEVFSLSFVTTRTVEATDSFGVPEITVTKGYTKMTYITTAGKNAQYAKTLDTITLDEATAYPAAAAAKKVYHVKNQIQWADKANNKVNLGIVCGFDIADIGIEFENGTSTNVSSVGVTATINGVTDTYTERFVYSAKEGTAYYFRAVIGNVPGDYNGTITITPFVVVDGETEYGNAIEITADVLASNVAKLPA